MLLSKSTREWVFALSLEVPIFGELFEVFEVQVKGKEFKEVCSILNLTPENKGEFHLR